MVNIPRISKQLCNQSIELVVTGSNLETDDWGKPIKNDITREINNVIVQEQTIYSGNGNSREITANAVAFLFAGITEPMPVLSRNDIGKTIIYRGKEWTITNLVINLEPFGNSVYSYELEVL